MATVRRHVDVWLLGVSVGRVLLYANFMTVAACIPQLTVAWDLSYAAAGVIGSAFLIAYAVSLVVFSALADRYGAQRLVLVSAVLSAFSAAAFGVFARSYESALVLYALAGATQGGVYTPMVMVLADRYPPALRGGKVGWLIASTSVGYAASLAISAAALAAGGWQAALLVTGMVPALGAAVLWLMLRHIPNHVHPRHAGASLWRVLIGNRPARYLLAGYTGHCWELLGMWSWLPTFLAANVVLAGDGDTVAVASGVLLAGTMHMAGAVAASTMGRASDRFGRARVLVVLALLGAVLSCSLGWLVAWPTMLVLVLALAYAFVTIGDSPVLSTALTEVVDPACLGSVLACRSLLGFGVGAAATATFGVVLDLTVAADNPATGWGLAFLTLGLGGGVAAACAMAVSRGSLQGLKISSR